MSSALRRKETSTHGVMVNNFNSGDVSLRELASMGSFLASSVFLDVRSSTSLPALTILLRLPRTGGSGRGDSTNLANVGYMTPNMLGKTIP